jgi:hypothetical protein
MPDRRDKAELVEAPPGDAPRTELADAPPAGLADPPPAGLARDAEPPVVARLVVEIRSDGSRTIARGAVEDVASGQRAAIEARGDSPLQLALALARSLTQLPRLTARSLLSRGSSPDGAPSARSIVRGLLGRRRDR